jgi:NAD(P)-dependent dehydrogenase (short-subunit alcohol dehydrogenase family)
MFQRNRSGKRARIEAPGFRVLAACRKPDDVERMNGLGFTGVLLDMDSPESVERAADEVIALTDNRLYGLFNNAGYGVYGPLDTSRAKRWRSSFRPTSSAYISSPCACSPPCCRTVKGAS